MGTQGAGWVSIAKNLLNKCHINIQVSDLKQCNAHVFVALYESILGEQVPDVIGDSRSPEDDAHNVQSVIDSLALDYLQISLSHITGENIVRGDTESIRNLLEIFDGLLEYLTEQISEASSQNGDVLDGSKELNVREKDEGICKGRTDVMPTLKPPPSIGSLSSDLIVPSWEADGSESTAELIQLGETAHTFAMRRDHAANGLSADDTNNYQIQDEPPSAVPLSVPCQLREKSPLAISRHIQVSIDSDRSPPSSSPVTRQKPSTGARETVKRASIPSEECILKTNEASKQQKSLDRRIPAHATSSEMSSIHTGHKKVAFRTQPDIRFMTLQDPKDWTLATEEGESAEPSSPTLQRIGDQLSTGPEHSLFNSRLSHPLSLTEEPLSVQRARNKLSELELQEMSDKLSRRLDELDQMLKKALGEELCSTEPKDEDKLSQHSDSIMAFHRKKQLQASQHRKNPPIRPRSLSSSPVPLQPPHRSPCAQFEDALHKDGKGGLANIRRAVQKELDLQRLKSQMLTKAYEDELKDFEEAERHKLLQLKEKLKENEQEFKENIFKEPQKKSHPERVYSAKQTRLPPRPKHWTLNCNKPPRPMKVKENDLLPLLLEEFPHLQLSTHTFKVMWKEQMAQVEQLARSRQDDEQSERKLHKEVEEAYKKHDLLVDIIRRERGHNQRLKDFKDRIRQQKSAENKMRENRQQVARAKKYYEDYHVQLRAKLMRERTKEERLVKKLFEEGLELQKERLREMRAYTKEQRQEQRKRHKDELESMENYYKDQFSMLAEAVNQEKQELQGREKAQSKTLEKMKRELRAKMEKEIQELQDTIIKTDEDTFFRGLEAERLKRRLQMATFQYSKSHCL